MAKCEKCGEEYPDNTEHVCSLDKTEESKIDSEEEESLEKTEDNSTNSEDESANSNN